MVNSGEGRGIGDVVRQYEGKQADLNEDIARRKEWKPIQRCVQNMSRKRSEQIIVACLDSFKRLCTVRIV